jgi:hypothetical protein
MISSLLSKCFRVTIQRYSAKKATTNCSPALSTSQSIASHSPNQRFPNTFDEQNRCDRPLELSLNWQKWFRYKFSHSTSISQSCTHTAVRLCPLPVLCVMLFRELIKFRYHSAKLDHCFVTYGQTNQHYSNDNFASPSWNRSGSMVTINRTFGWRSVTTPSLLVAWHVVAVGYAVGIYTDCVPYRWFNICYLKQNVQCCRTEAVQGRALIVTVFTTLSSWPSFSSHIIFKSYKFSNLEIYTTSYITLEFKEVILDKSVLMTLIKCTTELPKEGFLKSQMYVGSPYKVKCSWPVPVNCGYISAQSHHTVTHLSKLGSRLKATL